MQQIVKSYFRCNYDFFIRLTILIVLSGFSITGSSTERSDDSDEYRSSWYGKKVLEVDVAEDHTRFKFDEAPVFENGFPKADNAFVTHGYIYNKGFFDSDKEGVDGEGKPLWLDLVIGESTCRGYFVDNGANTTTGPWVISTQTFDFYDHPGFYINQDRTFGKRLVTTEGYELMDVNNPVHRAITGGAGRYNTTKGEHIQTSLGLGQFDGVKSRHAIKLRRW